MSIKEKLKDAISVIIIWFMMIWDDIKDTIITVVVTFLVVFAVSNFLIKPVSVGGNSMYPTIHDGSLGFSNIVSARVGHIDRFDIVIISPNGREEQIIKRVIGLPGETIEYYNDVLYVNGVAYEEDFLDQQHVSSELARTGRAHFTEDFSYVLGENEYFCMGDNRIISADSRVYGPFSLEEIEADGLFVFWPFAYFGFPD